MSLGIIIRGETVDSRGRQGPRTASVHASVTQAIIITGAHRAVIAGTAGSTATVDIALSPVGHTIIAIRGIGAATVLTKC